MTCPEFDCCECGRHIIVLAGPVPEPRLCAACMMVPGWLNIPVYRAAIDPAGRAREPDLASIPKWCPS